MIKDYWTKISIECYLILAVFLVIFLFFCRGSAWAYQFLGAVTFLVGILFINKHKLIVFMSNLGENHMFIVKLNITILKRTIHILHKLNCSIIIPY